MYYLPKALCGLFILVLGLGGCAQNTVEPNPNYELSSRGASSFIVSSARFSSAETISSSSVADTGVINSPLDTLFARLPGGNFTRIDGAQIILSGFAIMRVEVSQELYESIMNSNPARWVNPLHPVERINWYEAILFCNAMSKAMGLDTIYRYSGISSAGILQNLELRRTITGIRLPTEAEWEYAARAGSALNFFWGDAMDFATVSQFVRLFDAAAPGTENVWARTPNNFNIRAVSGNVREWVWDWHAPLETGHLQIHNPLGPSDGLRKVVRGGGWDSPLQDMLLHARQQEDPSSRSDNLGFRVVLDSL